MNTHITRLLAKAPHLDVAYKTHSGVCFQNTAEEVLALLPAKSIDLVFTSPPFPLNRKKKYGNLKGDAYIKWLVGFGPILNKILKPRGSLVVEVGNSWEPGRPIMSTLALKSLLELLSSANFVLCQQFVYYNPARLPSPAQWVNIERIRVKDAYTHLWWMAKCDRPKASNKRILNKYSESMLKLLKRKSYNAGKRPSEHDIGKTSFLKNNNGAIPSNVITLSNTTAKSDYLDFCRRNSFEPHPARMPVGLPEFFINFLTTKNDIVVDPFAGSNTTGAAAERLNRNWIAIEPNKQYVAGSKGRFSLT